MDEEIRLTLLVRDTSGNGVEDPLFLKVSDVRITTIYPAGVFGPASFVLPRNITLRPSLLGPGFEVRLVDGSELIYHGWVDGLEDVGGMREGTRVSCVGDWAKYMERRGIERRWADTDITGGWWDVDTTASGAELATDDRNDRIRITPKAEAWANTEYYAIAYQTPTGETVGRVTFDYDLQEAAQNWTLSVNNSTAAVFSASTSGSGSTSADPSSATVTLRLTAGAAQTPTSDGTYYGEFSNLVAYAARDHASATLGNSNVYEVALDIIDRMAVDETLISPDIKDIVSAKVVTLVPFVTDGYESYASVLARAAGFGNTDLSSLGFGLRPPNYSYDDLPRLFVEVYPDTTDYDYETSIDESGFSARLNLDSVWNYITVEYTDLEGNRQRVTPADNSGLTDATSVAKYGQREQVLRIGESDATDAAAWGKRYLTRHKEPTYSVTRPLVLSRVRGKNGGWVHASRVRAGKRIRINDLRNIIGQTSATGTTFLITKADYNHDAGAVSLTIGGRPDDLAVLLARRAAGY